jgi:hypothetical protein
MHIISKDMMGATSEAETAYSSGAHAFIHVC